jgi:hypothetical protein
VKESPKKIEPNYEEKQNSHYCEGSSKLTSNVKRLMDINCDEVALVASAGNTRSLRTGSGDKSSFGSASSVGQAQSSTHSITGLIKGMFICSWKRYSFSVIFTAVIICLPWMC